MGDLPGRCGLLTRLSGFSRGITLRSLTVLGRGTGVYDIGLGGIGLLLLSLRSRVPRRSALDSAGEPGGHGGGLLGVELGSKR